MTLAPDRFKIPINIEECEAHVLALRRLHRDTWAGKSDLWWACGLVEEITELILALLGLHRCRGTRSATVQHELAQISSIAMNWLARKL